MKLSIVVPAYNEKGNIKPLYERIIKEAYDLYYRLLPLCHAMFYETNPAPVKTALGLMGKISDEIRLPLCPMSVENIERLRVVLKEFGLI